MEVEMTTVSERGQIVIPNIIREEMKIQKSDKFLVFGEDNTIILKRIEKPLFKKKLDEITKPLQEVVKREGFSKRDLDRLIKEVRK